MGEKLLEFQLGNNPTLPLFRSGCDDAHKPSWTETEKASATKTDTDTPTSFLSN